MRLDYNLIRYLLLKAKEQSIKTKSSLIKTKKLYQIKDIARFLGLDDDIQAYDVAEYHLGLMYEDMGLIDVIARDKNFVSRPTTIKLTEKGTEFIELIGDDAIWQAIKNILESTSIYTLKTIQELANQIHKS